jgi:hypothetical protein
MMAVLARHVVAISRAAKIKFWLARLNIFPDYFSYLLGSNFSHTTKRVFFFLFGEPRLLSRGLRAIVFENSYKSKGVFSFLFESLDCSFAACVPFIF